MCLPWIRWASGERTRRATSQERLCTERAGPRGSPGSPDVGARARPGQARLTSGPQLPFPRAAPASPVEGGTPETHLYLTCGCQRFLENAPQDPRPRATKRLGHGACPAIARRLCSRFACSPVNREAAELSSPSRLCPRGRVARGWLADGCRCLHFVVVLFLEASKSPRPDLRIQIPTAYCLLPNGPRRLPREHYPVTGPLLVSEDLLRGDFDVLATKVWWSEETVIAWSLTTSENSYSWPNEPTRNW